MGRPKITSNSVLTYTRKRHRHTYLAGICKVAFAMCDEPPQKRPIRVLHVRNYSLVEGDAIKAPYAILSHRWGSQEVSYKEWEDRNHGQLRERQGYAKIRGACEQAERDGLVYLWVDTICINKADNAELSESINSMYAWYQNAAVCYAHLSDVSGRTPPQKGANQVAFHHSEWFRRGWTLQELLAPSKVVFFASDWSVLGNLTDLVRLVSEAAGIPETVLCHDTAPQDCTIAQRLSWASRRTTHRVEDMTYSLLGLLDINMSLRYGEGRRAFFRLQRKLLRKPDDLTVLAWDSQDPTLRPQLFATSPVDFASSGSVRLAEHIANDAEYSLNNLGLTGVFPVVEQQSSRGNSRLVPLYCYRCDNPDDMLALRLAAPSTRLNAGKISCSLDVDGRGDEPATRYSRLDTIYSFSTRSVRREQLTIKLQPQHGIASSSKSNIVVRSRLTESVEPKRLDDLAITPTSWPSLQDFQGQSSRDAAPPGSWIAASDSGRSSGSVGPEEDITAAVAAIVEDSGRRHDFPNLAEYHLGQPGTTLSKSSRLVIESGRANRQDEPIEADQANNVAVSSPPSLLPNGFLSRPAAKLSYGDRPNLSSAALSRVLYQESRAQSTAPITSLSPGPAVQFSAQAEPAAGNTTTPELDQGVGASRLLTSTIPSQGVLSSNEVADENFFSSFKVRRHPEAFFIVGRVFLMLWQESPGDGSTVISAQEAADVLPIRDGSSNTYAPRLWSKVRRFVVVRSDLEGRICNALPVLTYGGRGVGKPGLVKSQHAIIYSTREAPQPQQDERAGRGEIGMRTQPIRIIPDDPRDKLDPMSRIDFGTPHAIPYTQKVRQLGMVHKASMAALTYQFLNVQEQQAGQAQQPDAAQPSKER
ncbi:hypothetical protein LTS10_005235 [Elasticomyces elasticus]|nr:hypothetical protein LTS10_005235 [Elasticomyces elasticus]